jgi:hypothetical protein
MPAVGMVAFCAIGLAATRQEFFDRAPENWEGMNNRNTNFPPRQVTQEFGYVARGSHFGREQGEVGGKITPAGEVAYYGYRLPVLMNFDKPQNASGKLFVKSGSGHFLFGFFNVSTLNEWRTRNTLVARINSRGSIFHCHLEYCTSRWRAGAGVIGEILPNDRITAKELACDKVYDWTLNYDPAQEHGLLTLKVGDYTATSAMTKEHRDDGATLTHFGLIPVMKAWDDPGAAWMTDLTINGSRIDLAKDPGWDQMNNRRTYETINTRPRFDFGWSATQHAGGKTAGEMGGLIFRGDCREPARMGAYGDKLSTLNLNTKLLARGKMSMLRGVSDSTASIGFYHSQFSMQKNPSQSHSIPMDFLGINIEGPSSDGFFFYPVYRVHGDGAQAFNIRSEQALRIYPDGKSHTWSLEYDPNGANGRGQIKVSLDDKSCVMELEQGAKQANASFNRFGICTPWIDGNSVTAYFDDLEYTCAP